MPLTWFLFLRLLRNRSSRPFFSPVNLVAVLGIAFGMMATLVSLSVVSGFQKSYEQAILGFNAHIVLMHEGDISHPSEFEEALAPFAVTDEEAAYWQKHHFRWSWLGGMRPFRDVRMEDLQKKGVRAFTPFIFREGLGVFPDAMESVVLKGVDPKTMGQVYPLTYHSLDGSVSKQPFDFFEWGRVLPSVTPKVGIGPLRVPAGALWGAPTSATHPPRNDKIYPVIIGKKLLEKYFPNEVPMDPQIRILLPQKGKTKSVKDYTRTFQVVGTFESGLYEFDSQFVLASLADLQDLFHLEGQVSGVEMALDDRFKAPYLARIIETALPRTYQALSWDELNEPLFAAMKMEKTLFVVVMFLILLIASFNVMGIIMIHILGHQSEIAVLKALGLPRHVLSRTFALHGVGLGIAGIALGSLLSALLLWSLDRFKWFALDPKIYFITKLPVEWSLPLWMSLVFGALVLCYGVSRAAARVAGSSTFLMQTYR